MLILLMDEILPRFSYVSHPFQTLNRKIGLLTTLRRGMCANDRNPASPTHSGNVEIRGVRGARLLSMTCLSCWGSCRILSTVSADKFLTCEHLRTWRQMLLEAARMILSVHCFGRQSLLLLELCLTVTSASNAIPVSGSRI